MDCNNYVFCISTKDPQLDYLSNNINLLNKHYNNPDIHIIDSKSTVLSSFQYIKDIDNVTIHFANNTNYELGAWKYAVNNIPAENYICIQDTLFIEKKIDFNFSSADIYFFDCFEGWYSCFHEKYIEELYEDAINFLTKNTIYYDKCWDSWINRKNRFNIVTHTSFGVKRTILKDIFSTLKNLPTNKLHSCATERLMYWIFSYYTSKLFPVQVKIGDLGYWRKEHGGRQ